jgi:hypothetical protein
VNFEPHISKTNKWLLEFYKNLLPKVEALEDTFSIIIQGPLNQRSIKTIPEYTKYGKVIVSCWDNDNLSLLDSYKNDIKIIINKYSDVLPHAKKTHLKNPIILQYYNTSNALKECDTYFAIKLRSDESYPNLDAVVQKLRHNRDSHNTWFKIVTSNIYFRFDNQAKFHPSDHIVAGLTSRMKEIFQHAFNKCKHQKIGRLGPEEILGISSIETYFDPKLKKRDVADKSKSIELMKKHFDIIRILDLPKRTWTSSYRKYDSLRAEEDWCHHINDIDKFS